ncbi:MAG TPA: acyl-CoA dehydrogenase family protein [Candidatus Tectomicrobia bacterium]|nr:acyl-CoA dehydrogenase family protein [Candidatus Tectomicrobia bacterium]
MDFALQPLTESGKRFVALAERHAADFTTRAAAHDRDGSFPFENIAAMQQSGVMAACVPEELGGLGVRSLHDYTLGMSRLGRGDGSTAIAANMHIFRPWRMTRLWEAAKAAGDAAHAAGLERRLRRIGAGQLLMCACVSEAGTDILHPQLAATKAEGGWVLNGQKIFATMSPAAQLLDISFRFRDAQGVDRLAMASVPRDSPGLEIKYNWDALGMRGSGSHDVVLTDCFIPDAALLELGVWGEWSEPYLTGNMTIAMGLAGVFLGIAETARDLIIEAVKTRRKGPSGRTLAERPAIQQLIAEIEIDLAASRAILGRTAMAADAFFSQHPVEGVPLDQLHALMKDFQCAKWFVNRKAIDVVDRALTASGGAGYLSKHPLSRLYRDVRAGPFMQPFSPNEAFDYIAKVTLGLDPRLDA